MRTDEGRRVDELIEESAKLRADLLAASERLQHFTERLQRQIAALDEPVQ